MKLDPDLMKKLTNILLLLYYKLKKICYAATWPFDKGLLRKKYSCIDFDRLRKNKKSNTVFIFGSGSSLNSISASEWDAIDPHDKISFNWFIKQDFLNMDYHLARRVLHYDNGDGDHNRTEAKKQINHYFSVLQNNPRYRDSILLLQWEPQGWGARLAVRHDMIDRELTIFPFQTCKDNAIGPSVHHGLIHTVSTLMDVLSFAFYMGWEKIVLVGVDLTDTSYFWMEAGDTTQFQRERTNTLGQHSTAVNGIVGEIQNLQKIFVRQGIILYSYNENSLLSEVMETFKFDP